MDISGYKKRLAKLNSDIDETICQLDDGIQEAQRIIEIIENTPTILDELDEKFSQKTKLTSDDIAFLFLATGLQCTRWVFQEKIHERKYEAENYKSDRHHKLYNPSLEEIITHPVPFDTVKQSDGVLKDSGSLGHRALPGHDPIVGLIIGTANIATSTLTRWDLASFHVTTGMVNVKDGKQAPMDVISRTQRNADFNKIMYYTKKKLLDDGMEGKAIIAVSLAKEIEHLKSDIYTPMSLPLPFVTMISPKLASQLAEWGLDMANVCNALTVGKQATYATLINTIIAMLHSMLCDASQEMDRKLYEVRTRKILSISNLLASTSNVIYAYIKHDVTKLDFGGMAVTLYRLLTDRKFIASVKYEYIFGSYKDMILGEDKNRK